jgi:hypothetical protein
MIKGVYSLFDKKAKIHMNIFTDVNDGTAIRQMQQACNQENSIISQYPDDYALYRVSQWDDESGELFDDNSGKKLIIEINQLTNKETN